MLMSYLVDFEAASKVMDFKAAFSAFVKWPWFENLVCQEMENNVMERSTYFSKETE